MNVFYLDRDVTKCARYHGHRHHTKMILESAQMMSTVHWIADPDHARELHEKGVIYKKTHINHPCVRWAAGSVSNWMYLKSLCKALNDEGKRRTKNIYDAASDDERKEKGLRETKPDHRSAVVAANMPVPSIPDIEFTDPPQCTKDVPQNADVVEGYRECYMTTKRHLAIWKGCETPSWFK